MKNINKIFVFALFSVLLISAFVSAEMTEEQKKAIEAELKAAELAAEAAQQATEIQNPEQPGQNPEQPGQNGNNPATGKISGWVSGIGTNTLTIGVVGDNIFSIDGATTIKRNGQISALNRLHKGDWASIKYDLTTRNILSIEAEGHLNYAVPTTYGGTYEVTYLGYAGQHFGFGASNGLFASLDSGKVEIGIYHGDSTMGVLGNWADVQLGDTIEYLGNSFDGKAYYVKIFR